MNRAVTENYVQQVTKRRRSYGYIFIHVFALGATFLSFMKSKYMYNELKDTGKRNSILIVFFLFINIGI